MPVPSGTSSLLLGRERDIEDLGEALRLAAQAIPQIALVGGEAGIGKTTLAADLERRAARLGFTVATGHCLDIEAGMSFAPAVEAMRSLLAGVEDLESRPSARRMLTLLDPDAPRGREALHALDDLTAVALEAAAAGPVLLVLEDMHWADRSTQDFAAALSRTARGALLLVLTFRSDELHRRHPFRKTLTGIRRTAGARRIDLTGLDRADIAGIVAAHTDGPADTSLVDSVLKRSEGNPLYAEELMAAHQAGSHERVPDHLSDLLLARVDALQAGPRAVLRLASVNGTRLDTATLAELAGLDQAQMEGYLREALDANVLRQAGETLEFRHPLLREAAYDDLMPDERTRMHGRLAEILQAGVDADADPGVAALSRLAFHWSASHDLPRALSASVRAGQAAQKVNAAEQVTHFERALSLWDRVPAAETAAGLTRIELTVLLGQAAMQQQDLKGWYRYTRQAVDMLEPTTDRLVASRAYSALGFCAFFVPDPLGAAEAIRLAVEYAGEAPSQERAWALVAQAQLHNRNDRPAAALESADAAIGASKAASCTDALIWGLSARNIALAYLGRLSEARSGGEELIALARTTGMFGAAHDRAVWLAFTLMESGEVDRGVALARATRHEALATGDLATAARCGIPIANGLTWQGRFDEAETLLEDARELGLGEGALQGLRGELSLARGDVEAATLVMPLTAEVAASGSRHPTEDEVLRELQIAALRGDHRRCLEVAQSYLGLVDDCESPLIAASAARIGFHALAIPDSTPHVLSELLRDQATRQVVRAQDHLTDQWGDTFYGVQLALAQGYAARVAGQPGTEQFREAARLAGPFGDFFALEPRLELARELLTHGGRDEGRELLIECWTAAHDMGARGLEGRAFSLATRTRVPLPQTALREGPLGRLTPREREVLDLLATGATNKTIATALFITEKTASVHVSNILAKLGSANRGEAAALARQLVG